MDVFKFDNKPLTKTKMECGTLVNGLTSKMWVERYAEAGEFTFKAPVSSNLRNTLPEGSFVSHIDTQEIMIVENHEISQPADSNAPLEIVVTGRGFETFYENRIIGSNKMYPTSGTTTEYLLSADEVWNQAVTLIAQHTLAANLIDADDAVPFTQILTQITGAGESVDRSLQRGTLYERLLELLGVANLGIKVIRPGIWSPLAPGSPDTAIVIHQGVDRSNEIVFSSDTGEITSAEYLWSIKPIRNTAMVSGRWVDTLVITFETGIDRRMMYVDASDVDNQFETAPAGADLDAVLLVMQQRGKAALAAQKPVALTKAEVSKSAVKVAYRKDFDVGDIITVHGDYNETSKMRVSEYVEIEDKTGSSAQPTLTLI